MNYPYYHLIVYVPEKDAQAIRDILAREGAGKIGEYDACSFSMKGTGRFRPNEKAHPTIGRAGKIEEVAEERIEAIIPSNDPAVIKRILVAVKSAHPYEEPA